MFWLRKKATEDQVERATMFAAMLARASERDNKRLASNDEVLSYVDMGFKDLNARPTSDQRQAARLGVSALLVENNFIEELLNFRLANPSAQLPMEFREKMLDAIEKSIKDFSEWKEKVEN